VQVGFYLLVIGALEGLKIGHGVPEIVLLSLVPESHLEFCELNS
jgi:hypothetical protein